MVLNGKKIKVSDVMREVHTIKDGATFREVLNELICKKTNSLAVIDENGKFVGMVNARTLIHHAIPAYLGEDATAAHFANEELFRDEVNKIADEKVEKFMEDESATINKEESLLKAAMIASLGKQIRIPVLDEEDKPIGLLTRTELKQVIGAFLGIEDCFKE